MKRHAIALAFMVIPVAACGNELDALDLAGCAAIVDDAEATPVGRIEHDRLVNRIEFCEPYLRPWDQKKLRAAHERLLAQAKSERTLLDEGGM